MCACFYRCVVRASVRGLPSGATARVVPSSITISVPSTKVSLLPLCLGQYLASNTVLGYLPVRL